MRAFHIGGMLPQQSPHLVRVPIDHLRMHSDEPTAIGLFDHLQIVPVCTRLLALAGHPGRVFTRAQLLERVWGDA